MGDLLEHRFQIFNAPPATGPRPAAFADLAWNTRFVNTYEVGDLPLGDVEAVTDFVVGFQAQPASRVLRLFVIVQPNGSDAEVNGGMGVPPVL